MPTISVVCGTFGDDSWVELAESRALPSAHNQTLPPADVVHVHAGTLHEARNSAATRATGEWLVVCDADDQLDSGYLVAMAAAVDHHGPGENLILQPATLGVVDGVEDAEPVVIPPRGATLLSGNHLIVGCCVRRRQLLEVGGFEAWDAFEDWDMFLKLWCDGAFIRQVPDAVYRVHVRPGSRNQLTPRAAGRIVKQIRDRHTPVAQRRGLI